MSIQQPIFQPVQSPVFQSLEGVAAEPVYIPSIYQGLKDTSDKENGCTDFTALRISEVTGSGTVTLRLTINGVDYVLVFDTSTDGTEKFWVLPKWVITRPVIEYTMGGSVTSFELGQGAHT